MLGHASTRMAVLCARKKYFPKVGNFNLEIASPFIDVLEELMNDDEEESMMMEGDDDEEVDDVKEGDDDMEGDDDENAQRRRELDSDDSDRSNFIASVDNLSLRYQTVREKKEDQQMSGTMQWKR
ncbi:hypothetical protein OS493_035255 [Desmophyllum pertusum]|uniref:Uncharacterized protein n=1 Tax=Desmophyllum pertusum TaxID=174260 RepID=A0A9W9ZIQ8_9CNID|nr:hypothetical protein OS493_035255 [Desmophyllum pertusum]